jgi:hypothetical protein
MKSCAMWCMAPALAVALAVAAAGQPAGKGVTILVYDIDRTRSVEGGVVDSRLMVEALRRRLDPTGIGDIDIRPVKGMDRVEIVLRGRDGKQPSAELVRQIKELVAHVGLLEFKILANQHDDKQAMQDARAYFKDPANAKELDQAALRGEPPPGPRLPGSKTKLKPYATAMPRETRSTVTYGWVELGPQERHALALSNSARNDSEPWRKATWEYVQQRLRQGQAFQIPRDPGEDSGAMLLQGALFYARPVKDRNLSEELRRKKQFEYFVLARNPEIDPATGKETPRIYGSFLKSAAAVRVDGRPMVSFEFTAAGGKLFGELTGNNVPSGPRGEESQVKRHLAIILDGLVISAPTINSRITTHGQITGSFTQREVDNLVNILRSGALPAGLRPVPVAEVTIEPGKEK